MFFFIKKYLLEFNYSTKQPQYETISFFTTSIGTISFFTTLIRTIS